MDEKMKAAIMESIPNQEKFVEFIGRLFDVARPEAVYSEPVTAGDYTVITASEVWVGMGAGYGGGAGGADEGVNGKQDQESDAEPNDENGDEGGMGAGSGGGGGGTAWARPVAAISIGPDGVRVEPIVDPTKIAIAFFTTIGAMFMMLGKMRRVASGK